MIRDSLFGRRPWVIATAVFCCFLWGSAYPAIKTGYQLMAMAATDTASQMLFAGYRFLGSGVILLVLAALMGKSLWRFSAREWGQLALLGLLQTTLQYVFFYIGLAHATGVKAAIMNSTGTFFTVLLAHFIYRNDKLSTGRSLGCLIGFAGVVLINLGQGPLDFDVTLLGEGFIAIAALVLSISLMYGKRLSQHIDPMVMTAQQLTIGGVVLIGIGLSGGGDIPRLPPTSGVLFFYLINQSILLVQIYIRFLFQEHLQINNQHLLLYQ